eukprot:COSAG06_NODE_2593_length_6607_cov_2.577904_4_plen_101_part_00
MSDVHILVLDESRFTRESRKHLRKLEQADVLPSPPPLLFDIELVRHGVRSETPFLYHLYIKTIILPRQARDKHKENSKKMAFPIGCSLRATSNSSMLDTL